VDDDSLLLRMVNGFMFGALLCLSGDEAFNEESCW